MQGFGRSYMEILRKARIYPGDRLKVTRREEGENRMLWVEVAAVYPHIVLLDFGAYKESRRIADIVLGLTDVSE